MVVYGLQKMDMTTTKTVVVFAIIFGCFAVLYPKIFHPMVLHIFGLAPQKQGNDDILSKVPPHLRKGPGPARVLQEDISRHVRDDHPGSFRPGPHPGLRAAAEMKKQAATTTGTGKGMMGVVLPMYAVGIVIYLIYTLTKVFGKKEEKKEDVLSNNPFNDVSYDPTKKEFKYSDGQEDSEDEREMSKPKKQQRDLERLLLRADERNIRYKQLCDQILAQSATAVETEGRNGSYFMPFPPFRVYSPKKRAEIEMRQLKTRLLETEAQMSRILKAMETVSDKVITKEGGEPAEAEETEIKDTKTARTVDSSPDMETYEIIDGSERPEARAQTVEDVGPCTGVPGDEDQAEPSAKSDDKEKDSARKKEVVKDAGEQEVGEESEQGGECEQGSDGEQASLDDSVQRPPSADQPQPDAQECPAAEECPAATDSPAAEDSPAAIATDEKIPEKKEERAQEPRPDLRKRKQGKKARRDN